MNLFREMYQKKLTIADEAVKVVKSGDKVGVGLNFNDPPALATALGKRYQELENVRIYQACGNLPRDYMYKPDMKGHFFYHSGFHGAGGRMSQKSGIGDFEPHHVSLYGILTNMDNHINVFMTAVSAMDDHGFMTTGLSAMVERDFIDKADVVIVEVNENMPRLTGDAFIHISEIDYVIENTTPLVEIPDLEITETEKSMGKYVADLIENRSTIQLGIGGVPNAVAKELFNKHDLGVHTEMYTNSMMELYEAGVVTNKYKNFHPRCMTGNFAAGSNKLYKFFDNNIAARFLHGRVTNDEYNIGLNDNFVSINTALTIDLSGQVCSESIGIEQFSGTGGAMDFQRGARRSKGGKAIIALYSTAKKGTVSTIKPIFDDGSYVTVPRSDVQYIVTEYGVANMRGKTRGERARALIAIAHPDFRKELEEQARRLRIIG